MSSAPETPPPSNEITTSDAPPHLVPTKHRPVWQDEQRKRDVLDALRRGHVGDLAAAFAGDAEITPALTAAMGWLIESKRQNIAVLGNNEVFVRRTDSGDLRQVVSRVTLSLLDGTLYQIPDRNEKRWRSDPTRVWSYKTDKKESWINVPVFNDTTKQHQANVSYEGLMRMNAVVGCSIVHPATVVVDGKSVENPYVQRDVEGDPVRIVIATTIAGPTPVTGNIVVVQYVLDMDPRADLLHMLAKFMKKWEERGGSSSSAEYTPSYEEYGAPAGDHVADDQQEAELAAASRAETCFLCSRTDFDEFRATFISPAARRMWWWQRLGAGIGIAHKVTDQRVSGAYTTYIKIQQDSLRKAQTIAVRNAMKRHPAFSQHRVFLGDSKQTQIAVVGWTTADNDVKRYSGALDAIARGERVPGIEVIVAGDKFDPERDSTGDPELDLPAPDDDDDDASPAAAAPPVSAELLRRNRILEEMDTLLARHHFTGATLRRVGFPATDSTPTDEMEAMLANLRAAIPLP